jgi:hypothetical protein
MADIGIGEETGGASGGTGGAVRIPIVPTVAAPLRDAPPISRWRGAGIPETQPVQTQDIFKGIQDFGEKLGKIFAAQGANQRSLQANKLIADFGTVDTAAQLQAMQNGTYLATDPNNMTGLYKSQADATIQKIINDPANRGVFADPALSAQVQSRLYDARDNGWKRVSVQMGVTAHADQEAQLQSQSHTQAITAGANYAVAPDGSIMDGPQALEARQNVQNLIGQMKGHLPGEAAADLQNFTNDVALQRGLTIAQNQPSQAANFLKNPGAGVVLTPEQQNQITTKATEAIRRPMVQIDANNDAVRAQLYNKYAAQAAAGKLDTGSLYNDTAHQLLKPEDYQHFAGMPFAPPSDPYSVSQANSAIKAAASDHELDELRVGIASNPNLRGKELAGLDAQIEAQRNGLKTQRGQAVANAQSQIEKTFNGYTGTNAMLYDKLGKMYGVPTIAQLRAQAKSDLAARISGIEDPAEINKAAADVLKNNAPDFSIVGGPKTPPLPHNPRPMNAGESVADYAAYLRSLGIK